MKKVKNNDFQCSGCGSCEKCCPAKAIKMEYDNGFVYPVIDEEKCIKCGKCFKICPFEKKKFDEMSNKPQKVIGLKSKDSEIVDASTSGGAFTLFSDYILQRNGVIYGAAYDENWKVVHISADNKSKRNLMRGSKYVQSDLKDSFVQIKKDLKDGKYVMFTGTPCQCAGLKSFLNKEYDNLLICDIVCHGVPSPIIFNSYINYLEKKRDSKIVSYNFRDKKISWAGVNVTVHYSDGKKYTNALDEEIFTKLYFNHIITRPSCHECPYTNIKRVSDITIGDFWGIKDNHPDFYDKNGVSLVLINTDKGLNIFNSIKENCNYIESTTEKCIQPQLLRPVLKSSKYDQFWADYKAMGVEFVFKKYTSAGLKNRVLSYVKVPLKFIYKKMKNM